VSAAARRTERPSPRRRAASFATVVVFPPPLTPTTRMTWGGLAPAPETEPPGVTVPAITPLVAAAEPPVDASAEGSAGPYGRGATEELSHAEDPTRPDEVARARGAAPPESLPGRSSSALAS